ncbi:PREDICTED: transmembrane protein 248-like [Priapulus caudatus]|uniref:Transmembrane protein 248-like n=1 Tax=Priapulus caudatus TaxID=37621 RepID=A0ABM1DZQ8_PRICU|nr:PREDICTED: transmembrane protein 248-like [Priapulus caudatus]XP_014665430.1 PREDICTED: transmembrane protein 248-like [Priapulus caudatus]XP_014665431.1 PREDICTED: transmembrane protein 248-like [Priapulus caudatus]
MAFSPLDNLRSFATSRPPLVVFMICLLGFAVTTMTLAYYVRSNELRNTDIVDWNMFLDKFASVKFCIHGDTAESSTVTVPMPEVRPSLVNRKKMLSAPFPANASVPVDASAHVYHTAEDMRNYSVSVPMVIGSQLIRSLQNVTHMSATLNGLMLGIRGDAARDNISVVFELPSERNYSHLSSDQMMTCVVFQAPANVFPMTRAPEGCWNQSQSEAQLQRHLPIQGYKETFFIDRAFCANGTKVFVQYTSNPHLTLMLTMSDRSMINLHLMHTSYFLFLMAMTMMAYALLKNSPKLKPSMHEKLALDA